MNDDPQRPRLDLASRLEIGALLEAALTDYAAEGTDGLELLANAYHPDREDP